MCGGGQITLCTMVGDGHRCWTGALGSLSNTGGASSTQHSQTVMIGIILPGTSRGMLRARLITHYLPWH